MNFKTNTWMRPFFLTCLFLLFSCTSFIAEASEESCPVKAELLSEEKAVQPGRPFWVGVQLHMEKGWDTYWLNPGDCGFATQVNWKLPEGFKVGPLLWPYPEKFVTDSLVAFGYTDDVLLMAEILPPNNLAADQKIVIQADVNWLACNESCVPGQASLELSLPITDTPSIDESAQPLFTHARKALPQKEGVMTISAQSDYITLHFKPAIGMTGQIEEALFIPEQGEVIDYSAPQNMSAKGDQVILSLKRAHPEEAINGLKGILLVSEKGASVKHAIEVDSLISAPEVTQGIDGVSSVGIALLFAFLGGIILNVMPCVLPVVALKIFSFVKMANQKRSVIFQHGGFFSLGVLVSFWVLSGALMVLRAYGEGVGWGFQLQEPTFVVVLASLLFMLGLSLFGVFEMGTSLISLGSKPAMSSNTSPLASSFMSGVLATLVATPCTGPLLGPALGFAMTLPAIQTLTVFTSMGLGMAFPYILFSAFPQLVRFLPKPGNWMIAFKQIMGFLMMGTVIWLVWVFGAQTDNMATFVLLATFLGLAIGCWIFGKWAAFNRSKMTRAIATVVAALIICISGGGALMMTKNYCDRVETQDSTRLISDQGGWETYSPERVAQLRAEGTPVFIDFTAKWCLICQANKVVLRSSEITQAFHEKGVVTMSADWTKKDPIITQQLEKLGRTGVPVYVLYPGNAQDVPYILPQTLTANAIHEYLGKLKNSSTTVYVN